MYEFTGTTVHHVFLLSLQIAILLTLLSPYLAAHRAGELKEYIEGEFWSFGSFLGDLSALCLFVLHLFIWARESTIPSALAPRMLLIFYGWTAILAIWAMCEHIKTKRAAREGTEV